MMSTWMKTWEKSAEFMNGWLAGVGQAQQASLTAASRSMELMTNTYVRMWGQPAEDVMPADRRFRDDAWTENLAFDVLKQAYLINAQWMMDVAGSWEEVDPELHEQAVFWTQQLVDTLSPANFAVTNPVVLEETVRTGGANLVKGMRNLLSDIQRGRITQVPEKSFEVGKDLAITPGKVVYRNELIELIQYAPATEQVREIPILVLPPWINKYYVMDLRPENSMFKYLVDAGFSVFAISWKNPDESTLDLTWNDYMELGPLEALRVVKAITGAEKVNSVGYCLGGIAQQYVLSYLTAIGDESINSATYFATHQDFDDVGDIVVFLNRPGIMLAELLMTLSGGYLDGRSMAATFNMLRANDLLWRYVESNYLLGKQPPAFDILYWNSDGTRVPQKVHSYLLHNFFLEHKYTDSNELEMKSVSIDVGRITTPTYTVAALRDHIVPWKGAYAMRRLQSGPVRFILTESGHISGIINSPRQKKSRAYWYCDETEPETDPVAWWACAQENKHEGSWWEDWIPWLEERAGDLVDPPAMGSDEFPPLMDAPGTYVLEK